MKKFSKLFLSCAAVAAVTAAVATSAMAAADITATYTAAGENETAAKLTIDASGYTADQKTLLVLKPGVTLDNVAEDKVVQIDQNASIVEVALPADLDDGVYNVYMGGDGEIHTATFRVGDASSVLIGDADQDGYVDGGDATAILKYTVSAFTFTGDGEAAADADQDGYVDGGDATAILKYTVNKIDDSNSKVNTYK